MQNSTHRLYAMEASVHLYSNEPIALTPAELYRAKSNPVTRQQLANCNIYAIASRGRIFVHPEQCRLEGNIVYGEFLVPRKHGIEYVPFQWRAVERSPEDGKFVDVAASTTGTNFRLRFANRTYEVPAHCIVAEALSELTDEDRDLEVLYVGQGIGKSSKRSALDRLTNHSTFQRILAEAVTYQPGHEILLLLYQFGSRKTFLSTGGDLNAEPQASIEEERAHFQRIGNLELTRNESITLAEAALIKHFQPEFNTQLKECDFAARRRIKALERLLKKDVTGLMVEICSANIRSRLRTSSAIPQELSELYTSEQLSGSRLESESDKQEWAAQLNSIAHTHFANFPLTTPQERDTFMHGTLWIGAKERMGFMPSQKS